MSMSARMALTMGTYRVTLWRIHFVPAVSEEGSLIICVELVHQGLNPALLLPINARQVVDNTNTVLSQTSARLSEHNSSYLAGEEPHNNLPRLVAFRLTDAVRVFDCLA